MTNTRSTRLFLSPAKTLCLVLILLFSNQSLFAQAWNGIISPTRATDWSSVGVVGDIPSGNWPDCTTSACNTLFSGNVTPSTIQSALSSAPANSVVRIPAGTFSLSSGFSITQSNVVLRGAGSTATKLNVNGTVGGAGVGLPRAINLYSGAAGVGHGPADGFTAPSHTASWTAGYSQGTNVITLSATTGLTAGPVGIGSLIMLDQLNDSSDGWPATGDINVCENASSTCSNQGGNNYARAGRAQVQVVTVTAISGNQVTITPPVAAPNYRSSQSPGAYWNDGSPLHNSGLENLTVDYTVGGGSGIFIKDAANCWVKGVRWIKTNTGTSESYGVFTLQSVHLTIRSNYFYGRPWTGGSFPLANYNYTDQEVSDVLFENNIMHYNITPVAPNDPATRNVFGYNYFDAGSLGVAGIQLHSGTLMLDLFEGNNMESLLGDVTHGTHFLSTLFRNHFDGETHNNSVTTGCGVCLLSNNRFFNVLGNVFGAASYTRYETTLSSISNDSSEYLLGWKGNNSGTTVNDDTNVKRTLMRWGNWDASNNAARFLAAEVPSTIANFPNPVPVSQTLPASLYLPGQPSWWATPWGTPKWPAIGPDVVGGNITNSVTGGHADKIPARLCFENSGNDPAYPSTSPRVKSFDASTCYASGPADTAAPSTPTGTGATAASSSQINVSWTASTDNVGVAGYKIFRNGTQVGTSASTSYQDIGLIPTTTYSYTVSAFDPAGNNSGLSGSASATTSAAAAPPVLSSVNVSNIGNTSATITWLSNIASDSQVEYGLTTSYGSQTTLDTILLLSHSQTLSGLSAGATYNFRVKSREVTGSLTTSANFTFTTTAPPPGIPLVLLKFDETGGTVAADSSGNSLNGTVTGGATFVAGRVGNAISLNGSTQSVNIGGPATLQLTGSTTISAWINSSSFPVDDSAIVSGALIGFQLDTSVDNGPRTIAFKLSNSSGSMMARYGASTLSANTWYYVTGVYNAASQTIDVYLNGNLDNGSLVGTVTNTQQNSPLDVFVGKRSGDTGLEFNGAIDEVRIYGRALAQVEIQADMNASGSTPVAPTITTQPANQTVSAGQTATFSVGAAGLPAPSYQWRKNGANISGATSASYTTPATVAGDSGSTFSVVVTNSAGTVTSNNATLTVNVPPTVTTQPVAQTVNLGQTATFSVIASGTPAPTYQWRKNGANISGATAASYTTPATVSGDNGATFTVVVTNSAGTVTSSPATLTVNGPPTISTQPANQTVNLGQTATFSVVAAGGTPTLTYQWRKNGANISGATSASYTTPAAVTGDNGATFSVVVTNSVGSITSNSATLTVNGPPTITTQPSNASAIVGQSATFSVVAAGSAPITYQWRKGGANISGAASASYTTPATVIGDNGSTFDVVVTNGSGSVTSNTVTLTVNVPPTITTQPVSQTVNVAQTATFSIVATGTPSPTYQWRKGGANIAGATSASYTTPATVAADNGSTFTVVVTNAGGSVTSNTVTLSVNVAPTITTQPVNRTVTVGQTATFSVVATGAPAPTYQWRKGGVNISGATSPNYTTPATVAGDSGSTYSVVVTNAAGSVTSNTVTLTVNTPPSITTQPSNQTATAGQTATFSVVATGTPSPTYQWRKGGANISGATSSSYTTPATVAADDGSTYSVVVTNASGSATSNVVTLTVNTVPSITTQPANQSVTVGQTATFSVVATGKPTPAYQWRKGGVNIAGATAASYTTPVTQTTDSGTTYDVVVTNSVGSATSSQATLTVNPVGAPIITTQPLSQTVVAGQTATFSVVVTGASPTYQWRRNGVNISGATSSSYTTPATAVSDSGSTFDVVVSNSGGNTTSNTVALTVTVLPAITTQPASQAVVSGQPATFFVVASGSPAPTYQWRKNGTIIAGATASSYLTPPTSVTDNGSTFDVVVTNSVGSVTSTSASLTVASQQGPTISITAPANGAVVLGVVPIVASAASLGSNVVDVTFALQQAPTGPAFNLAGIQDASDPTQWQASWVTTSNPDGNYIIAAIATDSAGRSQFSSGITVAVDNPDRTDATRTASIPINGVDVTETTGSSSLVPETGSAVFQLDASQTDLSVDGTSGVAIIQLRSANGTLISETGVPSSTGVLEGRIYADVEGSVNTGIAIANPNTQDANISFYFTDATGRDFGNGTLTLRGIPQPGASVTAIKNQVSAFLNQAPFNLNGNLHGTFTFTSNVPIGVIALRGLVNEAGQFLMSTLPVAPLGNGMGNVTAVLPHFADGAGWTTQIILTNTSDNPETGSVQFLSGSGSPATLTVNGGLNSTFNYLVPRHSSLRLVTAGGFGAVQAGSVRIVPDTGNNVPTAISIFSFKNAAQTTVTESSVPAQPLGSTFRLFLETFGASGMPGGVDSGVAIANPSDNAVTVTFNLMDSNGAPLNITRSINIPARGQVARFTNEIFQGQLPSSFQGIANVTVSSQFSSQPTIALTALHERWNENRDFLITTTPPMDQDAPPATQVLFPQVVTGGGYTTDFILFGQSGMGRLWLFNQDGFVRPGTALTIPKK